MTHWLDDVTSDSKLRARIGWRGELEFAGATEDDRAGRVARFRLIRRPEEQASAHPFSQFTRRRGKKAGSIFEAAITFIEGEPRAIYTGEVMLLGWADGPGGSTVALLLDAEADRNPFLIFSRPSKQVAGSRFMAVFLEQADDIALAEQEAHEHAVHAPRGPSVQHLSNVAALIIKNPRFHDFLREHVEAVDWNEKSADGWLKDQLKIKSKAELDLPENERRIAKFHKIRERFVSWQSEQGYDPRRE